MQVRMEGRGMTDVRPRWEFRGDVVKVERARDPEGLGSMATVTVSGGGCCAVLDVPEEEAAECFGRMFEVTIRAL